MAASNRPVRPGHVWCLAPDTARGDAGSLSDVRELTDATFEDEVLKAEHPVVVDFWAPWCGPCKAVEPILADLAEASAGRVEFAKLNIDENFQTAARYGVLSIPTADPLRGRRSARERRRRPLPLALRRGLGRLAEPYGDDDSLIRSRARGRQGNDARPLLRHPRIPERGSMA